MKDWAVFDISENETDKLIYLTKKKVDEKRMEKATRKSLTWYTNG